MTALVRSLMRIWSAKNRVPRPTRRGMSGSTPQGAVAGTPLIDRFLTLVALARRTAPTIVVIVLNIFR